MFKKKENGFSLVELAVAAAIATALAVVAVTVVTGTATSVSEKGSSAAAAEECTISESLKGGTDETINDCVTATSGGSQSGPTTYTMNFADAHSASFLNVTYNGYTCCNPNYLYFEAISDADALGIVNAINAGATSITVDGVTYSLGGSSNGFVYQPNDTAGHTYMGSSSYGSGSTLVVFVQMTSAPVTSYYGLNAAYSAYIPVVTVQ